MVAKPEAYSALWHGGKYYIGTVSGQQYTLDASMRRDQLMQTLDSRLQQEEVRLREYDATHPKERHKIESGVTRDAILKRLELEIQTLTLDLTNERNRLSSRIEHFEKALPEAQEAARKQALAELQAEFDAKLEEANRLRSRLERKHQDAVEQAESELRRARKQIASLEEQLKEAKEAAYKAQKARN